VPLLRPRRLTRRDARAARRSPSRDRPETQSRPRSFSVNA
jgi:hypothetical protein